MSHHIMYVCDVCQDNAPEQRGRDDRTDLRVMPDGTWCCDECYDDYACDIYPEIHKARMNDAEYPSWGSHPTPPMYVPVVDPDGDAEDVSS